MLDFIIAFWEPTFTKALSWTKENIWAIISGTVLTIGSLWGMLFGGNRNLLDILGKSSLKLSSTKTTSSMEHLINDRFREISLLSHTKMRFGDPTVSIYDVDATNQIGLLKITDVYTPLSVATEFVSSDTPQVVNKPVQNRVPIVEALELPESNRALVLGDPGAGKSTLIDVIVCKLAKSNSLEIPIHVRLSELSPREDLTFWHAVDEIQSLTQNGEFAESEIISKLSEALSKGQAIILFDGIDELSEKNTGGVIQTIRHAEQKFPHCQIIATCRTTDYQNLDPQFKLNFSILRLLPFDLSDIIDYVDRWYSVLEQIDFLVEVNSRKRDLQDTLRNSSELTQLGATPLLLTLMVLVHTTSGGLPKSRALLYSETLKHLLAESPLWRRKYGASALALSDLLPVIERLGFEIHKLEVESDEPVVGLSLSQIHDIITDHFAINHDVGTAQYKQVRRKIELVRERVENSNGLLVETRRGHLGFSHRSLQEFAAGKHFLNQSSPELIKSLATSAHWREPLILMAGYGGREANALFFISKVIEELTLTAVSGAKRDRQLAILSGEMLAEIGKDTLIARGQSWIIDDLSKRNDERLSIWTHVVEFLTDAQGARDVEIRERITILRVLGRLGDKRFVDYRGNSIPIQSRLSYFPPTSIEIGDKSPNRPKPKSKLVETTPIRKYVFDQGFHVVKYPITNIEYAQFIENGGYEDYKYWCEDGRKWLKGEHDFRGLLQTKTKEWVTRDFGPELASGKYRMEDILRESDAMTRPRKEPFFWRNERYNQSNQPVVGINLWEAKAYCFWLQEHLKELGKISSNTVIRLPLEREWERAARGSVGGTVYPWGDEPPTAEHAHTRRNGLDLDYATPVGSFSKGRTNFDLYDMAGNVWEWTISRAVQPLEEEDYIRDNMHGIVDVVVRGGSWFSDEPESIRCGYRGIDLPQNVYYDVGFRPFVFNHGQNTGAQENERNENIKRNGSARSLRPN
ncbi:SUMF1/EgtB/PvdO family nonheme iron enzyme [Pseudoalteromonas sp. NJ631]|uniref:SUMF1/EgtB/PvdO family nonheme iron enzyme n=1 Tax=Pseudoalteromonas sp. NJ631 TaxID=493915 RepID=UPI0002E06F96|nr:SUMF1/EgtB/PvdO family nonheme iron enzyme [Pseudoalteromonas sp. NJ631]